MLQVARLSPNVLGDSVPLVADFLRNQITADGGFRDREGKSDLYYTAFGMAGLMALQVPVPVAPLAAYLRSFGDGRQLDLVHAACLARCWALLPPSDRCRPAGLAEWIEAHRAADGGYAAQPGAPRGTVYACFLALGAYQDLELPLPEPERMLDCIQSLRAPDGGYANGPEMPLGLTPPSAAAATLLRQLGWPPDVELRRWLLARCLPQGGFFAAPQAPIPDLLSTATALHALAGMQADLQPLKEPCLDFVDSLWTARGGFFGNWEDDELDCEYTYYGLLALGHLSL